jgi:hypothetical protein
MKGTCNKCVKIGTDTGKGNSIQIDENRINYIVGRWELEVCDLPRTSQISGSRD